MLRREHCFFSEERKMRTFLTVLALCLITAPAMADKLAEFTFDADTADTAGGFNGILGSGATVADGYLTLDGGGYMDLPAAFGAVNPFDGSGDFSILMDFKSTTGGILMSSARDNTPDNHAMSVYMLTGPDEGEVLYDNFWVGAAGAGGETGTGNNPGDGLWRSVLITYDADGTDGTSPLIEVSLLDGQDWDWAGDFGADIPDIALDTVRIGGSLNAEFPYEELPDPGDWILAVDNIRIYNEVVPEPATLLLFALGGAGLIRRRR